MPVVFALLGLAQAQEANRRPQTGAAIAVAGGAAAIGGGVLALVGRSTVNDVIEDGRCREVAVGFRCTPGGSTQATRGEVQQIVGATLLGVGTTLAATGIGIELTRAVRVEPAPRGMAVALRW